MALHRILVRNWTRYGYVRAYCQTSINVSESEDEPRMEDDLIEKKRNKSGLKERHYKKYHRQVTTLSEEEEIVTSLESQRKLYGRYGAKSAINVGKLWPSKEELQLAKEYEKVARPHSVHEMIRIAKKAKEDEEREIQERQEDLKRKVAKLEGWKREVRDRIIQKEKEAQIAKEKKNKLIEEVRQILGFQIDPRDERFKEALLQKENEEKKAKKAAKKLARQQRLIDQLRKEADNSPSDVNPDNTRKNELAEKGSNISPGSPIV